MTVPEDWLGDNPIYKQARNMFLQAEVLPDVDKVELKWKDPNTEELRAYLVDKHGFSQDRVLTAIEKLKKAKQSHAQQRLESFFTVLPSSTAASTSNNSKSTAKRKPPLSSSNFVKGKGSHSSTSSTSKRGRKK